MIATIVVFLNVFLRASGFGVTWVEEGSRYLIVWLTFVGGALCAKYGEHVGIDLLVQFTPPIVTKILITIGQLVASIFAFIFTYYGWLLVLTTKGSGQISTGTMIPMWIVYLCIPIGSLLMAIRFLQQTILTLRKSEEELIKKEADEDDMSRL